MGRCEVASWSGRANNEHGAGSRVLYRSTSSAHENRRVKSSYEGNRNIQRSVAAASDLGLLYVGFAPTEIGAQNILTPYFIDVRLSHVMCW